MISIRGALIQIGRLSRACGCAGARKGNVMGGVIGGIFGVGFVFIIGLILFIILPSLRICSEWERKVVLRLGRFAGVRGPGVFLLLPWIERTPYTIDMRVVTSSFTAEQTLTRDNVPVSVDTIVFWRVFDPARAVL